MTMERDTVRGSVDEGPQRVRFARWQRSALVALIIGFTIGAGASLAIAGTAHSAFGYKTINGHEYVNYATIVTSANSAQARTSTQGCAQVLSTCTWWPPFSCSDSAT